MRFFILAALYFYLTGISYSQISNKDWIARDYNYRKGIEHYENGDYDSALYYLSITIKIDSTSVGSLQLRASSKYYMNDMEGAIQDWKTAITYDPDHSLHYYNIGLSLAELDRYTEAVDYFNKALEIEVILPEFLVQRSKSLAMTQRYEDAILDLNEVIRLYPDHKEAYNVRGISKYLNKDLSGACEDWRMAVSLGDAKAAESLEKYCD